MPAPITAARLPRLSDEARAQLIAERQQMRLARCQRPRPEGFPLPYTKEWHEGFDELEEALQAPWEYGERRGQASPGYKSGNRPHKGPIRNTEPRRSGAIFVPRSAAVANMVRRRKTADPTPAQARRIEGIMRPLVGDDLGSAEVEEPAPALFKRKAGWRFLTARFWGRRGEKLCNLCGRVSPESAPPEKSHEGHCPERPRVSLLSAVAQAAAAPPAPPNELPPVAHALPTSLVRLLAKPEGPEKSLIWQEACRRGACINCGKPPRSTISHEPSGAPVQGKGVSQKVRDTLGTSKCWEPCHRVFTATGCLPDPVASEAAGKIVLRSREASLRIIHAGQLAMLRDALERLPQCWQIEALSAGIAKVPESVLGPAMLGTDVPIVADLRLQESLDETRRGGQGGASEGRSEP